MEKKLTEYLDESKSNMLKAALDLGYTEQGIRRIANDHPDAIVIMKRSKVIGINYTYKVRPRK